METKDIIEGNKLIADFLGIIPCHINKYDMTDFIKAIFLPNKKKYLFTEEELRFNKSWDWLIPVVERCYDKAYNIEEYDAPVIVGDTLIYCNIEKTFKAIIEFIELYNELIYNKTN